MDRYNIIKTIGEKYVTSNIEGGEFSYAQVLKRRITGHYKVDIRFYESQVAVLVETKPKFNLKKDKEQLFAYVALEQEYSNRTKIIAILANTKDNKVNVWKIEQGVTKELDDKIIRTFKEYVSEFEVRNVNDMTTVLTNTSELNRKLLDNGIAEKLRSQFVGTCLLALKRGLQYKRLSTAQIIAGINEKLGEMLEGSMDRAHKLDVLYNNVLQSQDVKKIDAEDFCELLEYIDKHILPYINDKSKEGHDILSYFFTTFNKYVAREDKNQAFTPNHISHFMCRVAKINKYTRVLDPTCGSGTFLVQAMTQALAKCDSDAEKLRVKKEQIYGIEYDSNVFGLSTTNMLIHGDGNSNIVRASCFDEESFICQSDINLVLMNPPYNASKSQMPKEYGKTWGKASTDPSKGLFFVQFVADKVNKGRLLTLLPMTCAIKTEGEIGRIKEQLLEKHTLDAVFSFPSEMFYPGASAVACCMVFDLGKPHQDHETFFGYFKEDGFEKRKGVGRVDVNNKWNDVEKDWYELYNRHLTVAGKSVCRIITAKDEWCAEAYMETDYSTLCDEEFIMKMRDYAAFLVATSDPYALFSYTNSPILKNRKMNMDLKIETEKWEWFLYEELFEINGSKTTPREELEDVGIGEYPYVTTQAVNNGIAGFYKIYTEQGNVLTVDSAVLGFCAYQAHSFSASDHVEKLIPKFKCNKYIALFLVTLINREQYRYNYGRKCSQKKLKCSKIKLPSIVNECGKRVPNWQWMEDFIKTLPYSESL